MFRTLQTTYHFSKLVYLLLRHDHRAIIVALCMECEVGAITCRSDVTARDATKAIKEFLRLGAEDGIIKA